jgi:hypothetical protein
MKRIKKEVIDSPFKDMIERTDIFSDVMLGNLLSRNRVYKEVNRKKKYIHDTDKTIKACPKCNRCWERTRLTGNHRDKKTIYYDNFPKLGKEIKSCNKCKSDNE